MSEPVYVLRVAPDASTCQRLETRRRRTEAHSGDKSAAASETTVDEGRTVESSRDRTAELVPDGGVEEFPDDESVTSGGSVASDGGIEGEYFRALADTLSDGILVIDADSTIQFANPAVEKIFGYPPEDLVGSSLTELMPSDLAERHRAGVERYLRDGERHLDWEYVELTGRHRDGHEVPLAVSFSEFTSEGESWFTGITRDISDRQRREEKITSLNELFESLADAESTTETCDLAVNAAVDILGFPNAAVARYDDEAGTLVSTVRRWTDGEIDDTLLGRHGADVAWHAFVEGETRVLGDLDAELDDFGAEPDAEARMGSAVVIPLGKYGVFLAAAPEREAFDGADRSLADMLCSNVRSALDRADREETLRRQRNQLQEKNRELERVNRLNRVMRELTKALTRASSRDDVIRAVCERLTETGPYRFAWFGEHDRATDDVRPEASAGVEEGYLEEVVVKADEGDNRGQGPSGRAVRTREVGVQNDLLGDPPFDPWREQALKRGYRSSAAVPVVYDGTLRGVLNLYAGEPDVFDETETEVLAELGSFIGYALNALEQKQALVSERSIELDFRIRGSETPVLAFVTQTEAEFEFENVVQRADGRLHAFFTIRGSPPEELLAFSEEVSMVEDMHLVAERDGEYLYECVLGEQSFAQQLVDRGAMLRSLTATSGEGRFVVRIPQSANVRTFVDLFEDRYEQAELVARREVDEPVMSRQQFEAELADRLTDRQVEVLRMAYFGGFFEWPRESTAEEIAEALDVSQPTVSRHIRAAERVLFELLFEER